MAENVEVTMTPEVKGALDGIQTAIKSLRDENEKVLGEKIGKSDFESYKTELQKDLFAKMDKLELLVKSPEIQKGQQAEIERKDREAFKAWACKVGEKSMLVFDPEKKELATDMDTVGGYRVLSTVSGKILENLFEIDPIRANANVEPPISGDRWEADRDDNLTTTTATEERGTRAATATDTMGKVEIYVKERYALPSITQRMLDMASFDPEAWLQRKLTRQFAYQEAYDFLLGDGVSAPEGLLTNAALIAGAQHSGNAGTIPLNTNFDVFFTGMAGAIKMGYHGECKWYLNRTTWFKMLTYKYATGVYMIEAAARPAGGWNLLGYPVVECPSWPAEGAGTMAIGFGNLKETYTIIDNPKITILRDPFTTKGWVIFYTTRYYGGKVVKTESFKLMECAA